MCCGSSLDLQTPLIQNSETVHVRDDSIDETLKN